jgi:hypothetical protein
MGLILNLWAILFSIVLTALFIHGWRRANQRRTAQNLPRLGLRDLWPAFTPWLSRHLVLALPNVLEIGVLIGLGILYTRPLLKFNADLVLPGEAEILTGIAKPIVEAFYQGTEFPLWNPYVQHGKSLIADPFLFVFNPLISLPMLFFGVNNGAKIAVAMAFPLAATGMWTLMKVLDTKRPVRLWCGASYMLAGGMPAHLWAGHFQLAVGLAWVPWCFAGVLYALQDRTRRSVALAALPLALLFLTGNLYVPFFVLMGLVVLFIVHILHWQNVRILREQTQAFVLVGVFALGLVAVQLVPEWTARSYIHKGAERDFPGSQTVPHLLTNYLISEPGYYSRVNLGNLPEVQEYYNYVGVMPFVLLIFLVPAIRRRRAAVVTFATYFVLMLAWGAVKFSPIGTIFAKIPFLYQFRFPARALRVGAFALVSLAGLGLEEIWMCWLESSAWPADPVTNRIVRLLLGILVLTFVVASVVHLYETNRSLLILTPRHQHLEQALGRLATHDSSEYTVANHVASNAGVYTCYEHHLRSYNVILGWTIATLTDGVAPGAIQAEPEYIIVPTGVPVGVQSGSPAQLVENVYDLEIWRIPDALPFAFTVSHLRMQEGRAPVQSAAEVAEQKASRSTANEITVLVSDTEPGDILIVLESWFLGWRVSVDGLPRRMLKADGFLATSLHPRDHIVTFRYDPRAFKIGLGLSIGTMCVMMVYVLCADEWLLRRFTDLLSKRA